MFKYVNKKAFTLVELLAVITIIGLLLLITVPLVTRQMNDFRKEYYADLEESIKAAGKDYIADKRFIKPTELLQSKVIKLRQLEDEGYIDEVKDYSGNSCDKDESYVVIVKIGQKDYDYQTCLRCSLDKYETHISNDENNYCQFR